MGDKGISHEITIICGWQSALSSSVEMTPNRWDQLMHWRAGLLPKGPRWAGGNRATGTLGNSRTNAKSCFWEGIAPCNSTGWGLPGWGAALLPRRAGGLGGQWAEHEPAVCPCRMASKTIGTGARMRGVIITLRKPHLDAVSNFPTELRQYVIMVSANTGKQSKEMSEEWEQDFCYHSFSKLHDRWLVPLLSSSSSEEMILRQGSGSLPVSPALALHPA